MRSTKWETRKLEEEEEHEEEENEEEEEEDWNKKHAYLGKMELTY